MTTPSRASRAVFGFLLAALATAALILSGIAPAPPVPENLMLFVGRFHPLMVHLPIGFLAAIAALQVLQWVFRFEFRTANRVLLWLCALSALASTALGTLLIWPGGYTGEILDDHRWFGIATSVACVWMLVAHHFAGGFGRFAYTLFLVASLGFVAATGHFGGSLTHGEDYLTAYLPVALGGKPEPVPVDKGTKEDAAIYVAAIQPIIEAKCVECHNPSKSNGNLRMDSLDLLLAGGKHGSSLLAGDAAASLMIQRANLPLDDKEHMPPKGKPQLTDPELELLGWWIDRGAKERVPLIEDLPPKAALALLEQKLGFPVAPPELPMLTWDEVKNAGAPLAKVPYLAVRRVAMDSPAVNVFIGSEAPDPDALIASLEPIKSNIVLLDAGKTKLTSAAIVTIAGFLNLEELRLQETSTTDEDVLQLAPLRKLAQINLNGTEVTDRSVDFLTKFPNLVQLALWDTTISPVAADAFIKARFPETKKQRIQAEIAALEAQLSAMKVEVLGIEIPDQPPPPMVDGELYWAPVAASASSEFGPPWAVTKLFDGGVKLADIGTPNNQGADYAGLGPGPHVFVYDMGSPINASGLLYAQRASAEDKAAQLEIRVANADPGAAAKEMPILQRPPDQVVKFDPSAANDRSLTKYEFGKELKGRYFVFKISGPARNTGGYELVLGKFPTSREGLSAKIAANPHKYGTLIGPKAKASISSDTDYTPADGLVKLLDPKISEIPFAFHTKDEKNPWVKVVFPSKVRLSAMSIVNRRELQERAAGLVLQRLGNSGEWETIWKSDQPREVWNVDLTTLDGDEREGTEFRFYITSDEATALHLANIALWGQEIQAPAPTPEPPKTEKKVTSHSRGAVDHHAFPALCRGPVVQLPNDRRQAALSRQPSLTARSRTNRPIPCDGTGAGVVCPKAMIERPRSRLCNAAPAAKLSGSRPNIILILTDDQGLGDLACTGNPYLKTPNLDRIHSGGSRFTEFQVSPSCSPTRAAIMSGRHEFEVGVTHTVLQRDRMAPEVVTVAEALRGAGYATGLFGKWHLGEEKTYLPQNRGFDEVLMHGSGAIGQFVYGDFKENTESPYFDNVLLHNDTIVRTKGYCTNLFMAAAMAWIKQQHAAKKPFFAYLPLNAPHDPMIAPEKYKKRFLDLGFDQKSAARYAMIENLDDNVGLLLADLERQGIADDTLVVFMTDNGMAMVPGTIHGKKFSPFNAGMKGLKCTALEGGTRVPSFWMWKGHVQEGIDIPALAAHIDLYRTFCDLAGAKIPSSRLEPGGLSLVPLLENPKADWPDRTLFIHVGRWNAGGRDQSKYKGCAVRTSRWRLMNNHQLYDIVADRGQTKDVAAEHPEVVADLRKKFDTWWDTLPPLLVNEDLPEIQPGDFALQKLRQSQGKLPFWEPSRTN